MRGEKQQEGKKREQKKPEDEMKFVYLCSYHLVSFHFRLLTSSFRPLSNQRQLTKK